MSLFDRKPRGRETLERRNGPREETVTVGQPLDAKERGQTTYYELKTRIHGQLIERLDIGVTGVSGLGGGSPTST